MKTKLTPLHLKLLLHAYTHAEPWPHNGGCSAEYEQQLVSSGLVKIVVGGGGYYECTERGIAHVEQICTLPFPRQAWVNENNEPIFPRSNTP